MKRLFSLIVTLSALMMVAPFSAQEQPLEVVASNTLIADVARQIGGDAVNVTSLVPLSADVHAFMPTPADIVRITQADLVLVNGAGLEAWLGATIEENAIAQPVVVSMGVNMLAFGGHDDHHDDHHDDDDQMDSGHGSMMSMGTISAAYMEITNNGNTPITLNQASASFANVVEIHETTVVDDIARMREVGEIVIPAGETVVLRPGGLHIMLIGITEDLLLDDTAFITLGFDDGTTLELDFFITDAPPDDRILTTRIADLVITQYWARPAAGMDDDHMDDDHMDDDHMDDDHMDDDHMDDDHMDDDHMDDDHMDDDHMDDDHMDDDHMDDDHMDDDHMHGGAYIGRLGEIDCDATHDDHDDDDHDDDDHDDDHMDDDHDDHDHGECDPHVWTDPANVMIWADNIASAFAQADPANADFYLANAEAYKADLMALDLELHAGYDAIPAERRLIVTNHDFLAYFASHYGFEVVGVVIPGGTTLTETSPQQLASLVEVIRETGVTAIFIETSAPDTLARVVASEVGSEIQIVRLYSDALDEQVPTYMDYLRYNFEAITSALGN